MFDGAATFASDAAAVVPHISAVGPLAPTPDVAKLVSAGSRFSEARWPGGLPDDDLGVLEAPIEAWMWTFQMSSLAALPARSISIVKRPGPAVSILLA